MLMAIPPMEAVAPPPSITEMLNAASARLRDEMFQLPADFFAPRVEPPSTLRWSQRNYASWGVSHEETAAQEERRRAEQQASALVEDGAGI